MNTRDDILGFTDLISMLILEEKNLGLYASSCQRKIRLNKPSTLAPIEVKVVAMA